jgi:AraC family ethanolamine operon transcriptional activator
MSGWHSANAISSIDRGWHSTVIEHAGAQAALQPWIAMECYQLSPGAQLAQMESLDLGSQQIVQERQAATVQKLGITPPNLCTVSYCTPDPAFRFSELGASEASSIYFMPGNTEFDLYVPTGAQTAYISFDQDEFLSGARALNPAKWEHAPQQLMSIQTKQPFALEAVVKQWLGAGELSTTTGSLPDAGILRNLLMQDTLQVACESAPGGSLPSSRERSRAFHVCRAARDFVEDRLAADVVPTIVDICRLLGVSERTLQYAFRSYVDMSPLAYLRLCRLNQVRASLRASDPLATTVTAVAMRFGFMHLGRFAIEYRRMFGEAPSATLAS